MRLMGMVAAGVGVALVTLSPARADTAVLEPVADTSLYSEDGDGSNGGGQHFFTGLTNDPNTRRALLRFDLGGIPAGSTITSVTLSLHLSRAKNGNARATSLHVVTSDWGESGSQAAGEEGVAAMALMGDATWTHALYPTVLWTDPGGDFVATASATTSVAGEGTRYAWSSAQMAADVQGWVEAPADNFGWILLGDETTSRSAKRFDSRDHLDVSRRPRLTVEFSPPGACCATDGSCALASAAACSGTYQGDGVSCASVSCPQPTGACCAADGGCIASTSATCGGSYQGDATSCAPNPCPVPTGACCDAGSCSLVDHPGTACGGIYLGATTLCSPNPCSVPTGACCAADGGCAIVDDPGGSCAGTYQGGGSTCSPNPCPQPTGACCEASGACAETTQASCGGAWQGDATLCSPNPCPQPTGACCAADGGCSVSTDASCVGSYRGDATLCSPNPCPQPTGACCAADGGCATTTSATCAETYRGDATLCSPNPCPQPAGACCSPDASCTVGAPSACADEYQGDGTSCAGAPCPLALTPYVDPLPLPVVAAPVEGTPGGEARYAIAIREIRQRLHRDLPESTVWVYDDGTGGSYPGPTIEARTGAPVQVTWTNDLRDAAGVPRTDHFLSVDECPHGAALGGNRVVTHLHGGHVPAAFDGHPEATLLPGESVTYEYPNWQDASTIWYHDHALGITRLNVYAGLAALYLIRDDVEDALDLPSGEYEVPLVIQDRSFAADGSLRYPESWREHFFGDVNLVNGKVWPYLEVDQGLYRFRIINGANSRTYTLRLSGGLSFTLIGVDGGLLEEPQTVGEITLGGAERADVLVDFSGLAPGTEILLTNSAPAPYPGPEGVGVVPEVMQLRVTDRTGHTTPAPSTLRPLEPLDEADAVIERDFELRRDGGDECGQRSWLINGLGWDDITEMPELGTTEVWRFVNRSGIAHPMHMHLVFFQVLDRQPFDQVGGEVVPVGIPRAPEPWERGWKDTVTVGPSEIVRVIARFEDFVGAYPYHCHILEHEDHEMMRQFVTVTECGDGVRGLPDEECDDGNVVDGDGCSAACTLEATGDAGLPDAGTGSDGGAGDAGPPTDGGPTTEGDGGCGCRITTGGDPDARGLALGLGVLGLLLVRRRRR